MDVYQTAGNFGGKKESLPIPFQTSLADKDSAFAADFMFVAGLKLAKEAAHFTPNYFSTG